MDTVEPVPLFDHRSSSEAWQAQANETFFHEFNLTKSANTLKAYRADLQRFAQVIFGDVPEDAGYRLSTERELWQHISYGEVYAYYLWMLNQGYAISSINRALFTIRAYSYQAMRAGTLNAEAYQRIAALKPLAGKTAANMDEHRPVTRRETARAKKETPTRIPADIVHSLLHHHPLEQVQGLRNAVLMGLLLELGLRASEVAGLQQENVNLEQGTITFYRQKTAQHQTLALSTHLQGKLRRYLQFLVEQSIRGNLMIGLTAKGKPGKRYLTPQSISNIVNQLGRQHGLDHLSAHDCRHHCITHLIHDRQINPLIVQEFGGWHDTRMVRHYVRQLSIANAGFVEDMYR